MEKDKLMMRRALELAARGLGHVSPGPLVGCVIVSSEGEVVGEGYFLNKQIKHAETIALEQAGERARDATAYITLEPHAHYGRTSPCTDALINSGIRRVVFPIEDPNPRVSGQGREHLRSAGVSVEMGLMAAEAAEQNEKYIHFLKANRPFVHLKLAMSLDGRIATRNGDSRWITGEESRARVHKLRHEYDAILVGSGTVRKDNPLLTDRSGNDRERHLLRVVLDGHLDICANSRLSMTAREFPVSVFTSAYADAEREAALTKNGVDVIRLAESHDISQVLELLKQRSIQSVLVEGGATVAGAFLDSGLIDKVSFFIAPVLIGGREALSAIGGSGAEQIADAYKLRDLNVTPRGGDFELTGYPLKT